MQPISHFPIQVVAELGFYRCVQSDMIIMSGTDLLRHHPKTQIQTRGSAESVCNFHH